MGWRVFRSAVGVWGLPRALWVGWIKSGADKQCLNPLAAYLRVTRNERDALLDDPAGQLPDGGLCP